MLRRRSLNYLAPFYWPNKFWGWSCTLCFRRLLFHFLAFCLLFLFQISMITVLISDVYGSFLESITDAVITDLKYISIKMDLPGLCWWWLKALNLGLGVYMYPLEGQGFSPHLLASWMRIIIWFQCSTGDQVGGKPPISVESVNYCVTWYTASYPQCEDS
jgi:hypothetical protein